MLASGGKFALCGAHNLHVEFILCRQKDFKSDQHRRAHSIIEWNYQDLVRYVQDV